MQRFLRALVLAAVFPLGLVTSLQAAVLVKPTAKTFGPKGGTGSVSFTVSGEAPPQAVIPISVSEGTPWLTLDGAPAQVTVAVSAKGAGKGTVRFHVGGYDRSGPSPRLATIAVGGQTFTVSQTGVPCKITVTPASSASLASEGGSGSFAVAAPAGCEWTAAPTSPWLSVTESAAGEGSRTVRFAAQENPTAKKRTGTIVVQTVAAKPAKKSHKVGQSGDALRPTFTPAAGEYGSAQTVTVSTATAGASIRYTTDGSTPTSKLGTLIAANSGAVLVSTSQTLKAVAFKKGIADSGVAEAVYTITGTVNGTVATPTFSPGQGTYAEPQSVVIATATAGASIRYTTDGSAPSPIHGTEIASGASVPVASSLTLRALAYRTNWVDSAIGDATYVITAPVQGAEAVRLGVAAALDADPRTRSAQALTPADYEALADRIALVPGVEATEYVGDTLGTLSIKVRDGGVMVWRHLKNDYLEAASLPADATFDQMWHPTWNKGWNSPVSLPRVAALQVDQSNTYATHFPVATGAPDLDYAADNAVSCPAEGRIAIVDFLWTSAHRDFPGLYADQYNVDGVMLYDRIRRMAEAAGFQVDVFKDGEINLKNLSVLKNYKIVILCGHGGRPGRQSTVRLGQALSRICTPELYNANEVAENGATYEELWKSGYIIFDPKSKEISWTSWLFRDLYQPAPNQLVMLNQCWSMLPFNVGIYPQTDGSYKWVEDVTAPVYNIGDGLMDAGVKVVFGYITPATPEAVVKNTMPFLRRLFGGYFNEDKPPWPHDFWPTCMSAQTFFRLPWAPATAQYAPKYKESSLYTMYAVSAPQYLREVCNLNPNRHAYMQSFMLLAGTPATALPLCWQNYWSKGVFPSGIVDPLCSQGDNPTTEQATNDAACAVKEARKVTNAMLEDPMLP